MAELLTLIATPAGGRTGAPDPPQGYALRPCRPSDAEALGRLYFASYDPGTASESLEEAIADIRASFAGAYGELWPAASPLIEHDGEPVGAVMTVHRAPWEDTPDCPFVIELFVARPHRRRGLARTLLGRCLGAARDADASAVALRVDATNAAALALYRSLGFERWRPDGDRGERS